MKGVKPSDTPWDVIDEASTPLSPEDHPVNRIIAAGESLKKQIIGAHHPGSDSVTWPMAFGFPVRDTEGSLSEILISCSDILFIAPTSPLAAARWSVTASVQERTGIRRAMLTSAMMFLTVFRSISTTCIHEVDAWQSIIELMYNYRVT